MSFATNRSLQGVLRAIDPRRSQAAGTLWLIAALSVTFSIGAAVWVGGIARSNVLEQHARRLALETDQLGSDLSQAIMSRLGAVRAMEGLLATSDTEMDHRLSTAFQHLSAAYPQFDWIFMAAPSGEIVSATTPGLAGTSVADRPWFNAALTAPWLGTIAQAEYVRPRVGTAHGGVTALGDIAVPVRGRNGLVLGVVVTRLTWQRSANSTERLTDEPGSHGAAEASLLDRDDIVIAGAPERLGKRWDGISTVGGGPVVLTAGVSGNPNFDPHFETGADGRRMLVARTPLNIGREVPSGDTLVQLSEPNARVFQRANALTRRILWVSIGLGILTALLGAVGAHQLTRRLKRLALSVASVERNETRHIDPPRGLDEVAQLGTAFANVLNELQRERAELQTLSRELERRVAVRTAEVVRLAEETRYAAIARERLKMARDLHDTLAHSMMALLSEIRYLRRLQAHDPSAIPGELARAEEVAHEGLKEVRSAITQMRATTVRDMGLGPALSSALERFRDRSGVAGELVADAEAARFGDERAEILLQMAQEALRNIERHAAATQVSIVLRIDAQGTLVLEIVDDGKGFDPAKKYAGHYGIVGLHEQAALIGATLQIKSTPEQGTTVCVSLPASPVAFAASL